MSCQVCFYYSRMNTLELPSSSFELPSYAFFFGSKRFLATRLRLSGMLVHHRFRNRVGAIRRRESDAMTGRKRVSEECEEESQEGMPASKFELDKPILGFHKKQLYAGKALKRRRRGDTWQYLMHWNGWGSKYDEWLNEDLLYPDTDESRRVAESLRSSVPPTSRKKERKTKRMDQQTPWRRMSREITSSSLLSRTRCKRTCSEKPTL